MMDSDDVSPARKFTLAAIVMASTLIWPAASGAAYHTYPQVESALLSAQTNHPLICKRVSLGATVQGRNMWALRITDNVEIEEDEPEFRYISTMHGDEVVGVEMCLNLIDYLTSNYASDPRVQNIVNSIELWIMPCMNPDGFVNNTRYNANGVDLNRSFPDPFTSPSNTIAGRQAETANIMNWGFGRSFTLAANLHGGALVVNYPFDNNPSGSSTFSPTPDEDMFVYISKEYSRTNLPMWNSTSFPPFGITNGAAWYAISGGMQDWSYRYMGTNEVTIEIGENKHPPESQLPTLWNDNRESMLAYIETCLMGVRGVVTDAVNGQPLPATVAVVGRDHDVFTDPDIGDYHRMLMPGAYDLTVETAGYDRVPVLNVVVDEGDAVRRDVPLWRTAVTFPNGGETLAAGRPATVTWMGSPSARFQVQFTSHANQVQVITDGFEGGSLGPDYTTGGNLPWTVTTSSAHSGSRSARAGVITHNQTSWISRTAGAGQMSFWYRVSSESNWDWFNFYIDGAQQLHRSGTVAWTQYSTTLAAGAHELKWEYTKDGSLSSGSDTVWIDDLQVTSDVTVWNDIVALSDPGATSAPWTPPSAGSEYKIRLRADYGGGYYGLYDESDGVFSVAVAPADGDYDDDGDVDMTDVAALQNCFGASPGAACRDVFDFDLDSDVDVSDFSEFDFLFTGPGG